ncbi:hypothetical protein E2320_002938, partial [Naja naja]
KPPATLPSPLHLPGGNEESIIFNKGKHKDAAIEKEMEEKKEEEARLSKADWKYKKGPRKKERRLRASMKEKNIKEQSRHRKRISNEERKQRTAEESKLIHTHTQRDKDLSTGIPTSVPLTDGHLLAAQPQCLVLQYGVKRLHPPRYKLACRKER